MPGAAVLDPVVKSDTDKAADAAKATADAAKVATDAAKATDTKTTAKPDATGTGDTKKDDKPGDAPKTLMADQVKPPEVKPGDPPAEVDYAKALKIPEKAPLTEADVKSVAEFAKANKLSPEVAQAVLADRGKLVESLVAKQAAEQQAAFEKLSPTWEAETRADKDFGGEKLPASQEHVKRALTKFADPEFRDQLSKSPFGNHRFFFRMLARIGAAMSEDGATGLSSNPPTRSDDPVERFYPSKKK